VDIGDVGVTILIVAAVVVVVGVAMNVKVDESLPEDGLLLVLLLLMPLSVELQDVTPA